MWTGGVSKSLTDSEIAAGMFLRNRTAQRKDMVFKKNLHRWLPSYAMHSLQRRFERPRHPVHILFCFVHHYDWKVAGDNMLAVYDQVLASKTRFSENRR